MGDTAPERGKDRRFIRCQQVEKPGVGVVHIHARPWRPNHVFEVLFYAPGDGRWVIPEDKWEPVLSADSFLGVMAIIRSET